MIRNFFIAAQLTPLVLSIFLALFHRAKESILYRAVSTGAVLWLLSGAGTLGGWVLNSMAPIEIDFGNLYSRGDYHFPLVFFIDWISIVFLATTHFAGAIILKYCRYYLHREAGYARFFSTLFLFIGGMQILLSAGTLDVLFAGWEIVGMSSFLLIGFYRQRISPVRNAFRAYCVYRICDFGLLLGTLFSHLLLHESQNFSKLLELSPSSLAGIGFWPLIGLSFLLLLAASGKSAQFPFCFWLPRAMEGPTPSSAIFYGALSIHAGVFLLLRTLPIWHAYPTSRIAVACLGIVTAFITTFSGRVQSNIKAQIGYASICQVGLMLVELALGLVSLAVFHFVANASLRFYQLLISPSVVTHLLRVQAASPDGVRLSNWSLERRFPVRLRSTLYILAFYEGYLEHVLRRLVWALFNRFNEHFNRTASSWLQFVLGTLIVGSLILLRLTSGHRRAELEAFFALAMIILSFWGLGERQRPFRMWHCISLSCALASAAVLATGTASIEDIFIHLFGILPCWIGGVLSLRHLRIPRTIDLRQHLGLADQRIRASFAFFLAVIGISGFPITSAFLGEDLLLHHALGNQLWLAAAISFTFVLNGISAMRLYLKLCLGPSNERQSINKEVEEPNPVLSIEGQHQAL